MDNRLLDLNITYLGLVPIEGSRHALIRLISAMQKANVQTIGTFIFMSLSQINSFIKMGDKTLGVLFEVLKKLKDDPYIVG